MLLNKVRVVADALRVLLQLRLERALCQHVAEGSPDIAPAGLIGVDHIGNQALGGFVGVGRDLRQMPLGIKGTRYIAVGAVVAEVAHIAHDHTVDVRDVVPILICDLPVQQRADLAIGCSQ